MMQSWATLQDRKKEMAKVIQAAAKVHEAREACHREAGALKAAAAREHAQLEGEWKRLGAVIDADKRNRELLRQREMDERNRKTQEVRSALTICTCFALLCCIAAASCCASARWTSATARRRGHAVT
jgi:hypothetical protein